MGLFGCKHDLVNVVLDNGVVAKVCKKCKKAFFVNKVPVLTDLPKDLSREAIEKFNQMHK